jgi:signal transduction histidine kinase
LLDVSRIIRGQLRLNINSVDLNQIIETALDTVRPAAEAKSIQLESCLKPATGSINGDPDRLQQIVWNLLSNAIKFTPPQGRVTIYLEWVNNSVQIKVKDTGKGLPANAVPYIFERFRQVESTTTRSHGGLGLGLAIVRHLVELHGGTVWCESPGAGMGATFIVELPLPFIVQLPLQSVYWQVDDSELASPQVEDNQLSQPSLALAGLRVLVVEDEPDALEYFKIVLEKKGHK